HLPLCSNGTEQSPHAFKATGCCTCRNRESVLSARDGGWLWIRPGSRFSKQASGVPSHDVGSPERLQAISRDAGGERREFSGAIRRSHRLSRAERLREVDNDEDHHGPYRTHSRGSYL